MRCGLVEALIRLGDKGEELENKVMYSIAL